MVKNDTSKEKETKKEENKKPEEKEVELVGLTSLITDRTQA